MSAWSENLPVSTEAPAERSQKIPAWIPGEPYSPYSSDEVQNQSKV